MAVEVKTQLTSVKETKDDWITLNVGGVRYATTRSVLTCNSSSMLAAMFNGKIPVSRDKEANYVINKDGPNFIHILNWLRCKTFVISLPPIRIDPESKKEQYPTPSDCVEIKNVHNYICSPSFTSLQTEAAYFMIDDLVTHLNTLKEQTKATFDKIAPKDYRVLQCSGADINASVSRCLQVGYRLHGPLTYNSVCMAPYIQAVYR